VTCEFDWQTVAVYAAGEMEPAGREDFTKHLGGCRACKNRLEAIRTADGALASLAAYQPSPQALLATRRRLSEELRGGNRPEIMTLQEAAEFLRISQQQLGEVLEELPAFELAGQVRIRRARLIEWIEQRERDYKRQINESWVERAVAGLERGVA